MSAMDSSPSAVTYRLLKLSRLIENRHCADCGATLAESQNYYASLTYRVWICCACGDVHRSIFSSLILSQSGAATSRNTPATEKAEGKIDNSITGAASSRKKDKDGDEYKEDGDMDEDDKEERSALDRGLSSRLKRIKDVWYEEEVTSMESAPHNIAVNKVLERFTSPNWPKITRSSSLEDRKLWIKAKYYSRYFSLPLYRSQMENGADGSYNRLPRCIAGQSRRLVGLGDDAEDEGKDEKDRYQHTLPMRPVDYFLTIGLGDLMPPPELLRRGKAGNIGTNTSGSGGSGGSNRGESLQEYYSGKTIDQISFTQTVLTLFPDPTHYQSDHSNNSNKSSGNENATQAPRRKKIDKDNLVPDLMSSVVFPDGLKLRRDEEPAPYLFTFVLTNENHVQLYGTALVVHELADPAKLVKLLRGTEAEAVLSNSHMGHVVVVDATGAASGRDGNSNSSNGSNGSGSSNGSGGSYGRGGEGGSGGGVFYAPKALVVLSHYPLFHLCSRFLQQIYHVSLSAAPLPLERYIANFMTDLPLPPQGRVEVVFPLPGSLLRLARPAANMLPMLDISFRPLFSMLSLDNVLNVFNCLCQEMTVCICSSNLALLTPVQEALLALLFPFVWQGCYVPVLPKSMLELLQAPVPLLVGVHCENLRDVVDLQDSRTRPQTVVFVHLDSDTVHFGDECQPLPLPKQQHAKLKKQLVEATGGVPRDPSHVKWMARAGLAFPLNEHLQPMQKFVYDQGVLSRATRTIGQGQQGQQGHRGQHNKSHPGSPAGSELSAPVEAIACTVELTANVSEQLHSTHNGGGNSCCPANMKVYNPLDPTYNVTNDTGARITSPSTSTATSAKTSANTSSRSPGSGYGLKPDNEDDAWDPTQYSFNALDVRAAFLRFFVSLFIDYQEHFSDYSRRHKSRARPRMSSSSGDLGPAVNTPSNGSGGSGNGNGNGRNLSGEMQLEGRSSRTQRGGMVSDRGTISLGRQDSSSSIVSRTSAMSATSAISTVFGDALSEAAPVEFLRDNYLAQLEDPFTKNMVMSQMFMNFVNERVDQANAANATDAAAALGHQQHQNHYGHHGQIRFFDEQIVAKRNRSKLSLSKGLTPFLNDASMAVTRTYTVPGPVTLGVTAGKSYRYSEFPALDARELQIAVDARSGCGDEASAGSGGGGGGVGDSCTGGGLSSNRSGSNSFLPSSAPPPRRFFPNEVLMREFGPDRQRLQHHETAEEVQDRLRRFLRGQTAVVTQATNTLARRRRREKLRGADSDDDDDDGSSVVGRGDDDNGSQDEEDEEDGSVDAFFMQARRRFDTVTRGVVRAQSLFRAFPQRRSFLRLHAAVLTAQQAVRRTRLRRELHWRIMTRKAKRLPAFIRMLLCRKRYLRALRGAQRLQSLARARPLRKHFLRLKTCAVKIQAHYWGFIARRSQFCENLRLLTLRRQQLLLLWSAAYMPLKYRAMFWATLTEPTFLNLAVYEEEMRMLYHVLALSTSNARQSQQQQQQQQRVAPSFEDLFTTAQSSTLLLTIAALHSNSQLSAAQLDLQVSNAVTAHLSMHSRRDSLDAVSQLRSRLQVERKSLYTVMKKDRAAFPLREGLFTMFGISHEKKRKQKIADLVWRCCVYSSSSAGGGGAGDGVHGGIETQSGPSKSAMAVLAISCCHADDWGSEHCDIDVAQESIFHLPAVAVCGGFYQRVMPPVAASSHGLISGSSDHRRCDSDRGRSVPVGQPRTGGTSRLPLPTQAVEWGKLRKHDRVTRNCVEVLMAYLQAPGGPIK